MDNMARALSANGITMQYCMPTPRHVLQGSKYSNLTSIRVSTDRFDKSSWSQAIFASRLAWSVGIWPWVDVFSSDEVPNLTIATLSAGVVGASDPIGAANAHNLQRAARADGVIVKPDAPLVPTDSSFLAEAQHGAAPVVAYTFTDHGSNRAVYVFAFRRGAAPATAAFTPSETGLTGDVFAYDMRHRSGAIADAGKPMTLDLSQEWANVVFVPVGRSGIALVGDGGKFVPRGRARISALNESESGVEVEVSFASAEKSVTLIGYATHAPHVAAAEGQVLSTSWSSSSGLFEVVVEPGAGRTARVTIHSPRSRRRPA